MKRILCLLIAMMTAFSVIGASADSPNKRPVYYSDTDRVLYFIQIGGVQMDKNGDVGGRATSFFTSALYETKLSESLSNRYTAVLGNGVTEADITAKVQSVPKQKDILKKVVNEYADRDAYIKSSNGKVIPWSKMTPDYYRVQWYVFKNESDAWHIDGVIIDLETDKEISIVVPDQKAERAACIEYDVRKGTFTPGFMSVKPNRPHAVWEGNNDKLVVGGFNEVWYTVLDEDSFKENDYVIPTKLMNAATAVSTLATARLSELDTRLQHEYGRIDSQAYKAEYIERKGSGTSLYVTPFIADQLSKKYGVTNDEYIWLAEGDSHGNVEKVYVMDRDAAGIDNLFDNE